MTSWFDDRARDVAAASRFADARHERLGGYDTGDDVFVRELVAIERDAFYTISLVTGDREFPDDMRELMQGAIAVHGVGIAAPGENAVRRARFCRMSEALELLHELFHELAMRRVSTRFGVLSDKPDDILALRDEHDAEEV